ncbi:MAG: methyl-accepting chemotaxis protein, partial [Acidimicrobiales bacterium]
MSVRRVLLIAIASLAVPVVIGAVVVVRQISTIGTLQDEQQAAMSQLAATATAETGLAANDQIVALTEDLAEARRAQAAELSAAIDRVVTAVVVVSFAVLGVSIAGAVLCGRSVAGVFRGTLDELDRAAHGLQESSTELQRRSSSTSGAVEAIAERSAEANSRIEDFATSIEHMAVAIKEISSNSAEASLVADDAVHQATETNATVARLGDSSAEIGQVIEVITSIAEQTNLLALNAT